MVMEETERNLREKIEQEAKNTLKKNMWEGYANDILTGLQKNPGVQPDRPIWELVQNARDVAYENKKAKIVFIRKQDHFVFQHNGQPFTRTTLQSLILQTSSKVREDIIQVGQYGTGFLTTHKFGLDFRLSGSLSLLEGLKFYNFSGRDFIIKRSAQDKVKLSDDLDATIAKTQQWGLDLNSLEDNPRRETIFEYQHNFNAERENAKIAIKEAPKLVPYVLALNKHIESISFIDEVEGPKEESFTFQNEEIYDNLENLRVYETTILHSQSGQKDKIISLFLLKSLRCLEEKTGESKFTIILPLKKISEGLKVFNFDNSIPRLYLYLPLLGSKDWGCNFLFHSPSFTCDQDSRDSIMLRFNPQAEVHHDQINKDNCQYHHQNQLAHGITDGFILSGHFDVISFRHLQFIDTLLDFVAEQCDIMLLVHTTGYRDITRLCIPLDGTKGCRIFHFTDFCKWYLFFFSLFICIGKRHLPDVIQLCICLFLGLHINLVIFDICRNRGRTLTVSHLRTDKLVYLCNGISIFRSLFFVHRYGKLWFGIF